MSALPDQGQFKTAIDQPFLIVATLWRGAMVERYARIEFFVDRSLSVCASNGISPANKCSEHLPMKRIEVLLQSLNDDQLVDRSNAARKSLASIKDCWHQRNAICHGRMRVLKRSIRIDWKAFSKEGAELASMRLRDVEMLEILGKMDRAQAILGCQLGSVDKLCAELSACST